jgi:hypothetical protein
MTDSLVRQQVDSMRLTLQAVEMQLGSGSLHPAALDDLKSAVDDIRIRIWAIMSAAAEGSDGLAIERFRLRRGIDVCTKLSEEFHSGSLSTRHPEAMMLRDSASLLGRRINEARDRAG